MRLIFLIICLIFMISCSGHIPLHNQWGIHISNQELSEFEMINWTDDELYNLVVESGMEFEYEKEIDQELSSDSFSSCTSYK